MDRDRYVWSVGELRLGFTTSADGPAMIENVRLGDTCVIGGAGPVVELGVRGSGSAWSGRRYRDSEWSAHSRYAGHRTGLADGLHTLEIDSAHESSGLRVTTRFAVRPGSAAVTIESTVVNEHAGPVDLDWITSACFDAVTASPVEDIEVRWADNDWLAEHRWRASAFRELLPDLSRRAHQHDARNCFARTARGTWSSDGTLPVAAVLSSSGTGVGWQIEHNGAWHWQIGESSAGAYISVLGPTDQEHQWSLRLGAGERFTTVPVTVALSTTGWQGVTDALTDHRRALRRPRREPASLPIVFNDYMNTLMGDPTAAKLEPLIDAAGEVGAQVFCIDAGWYDDDAGGWWDSVGAWEPASSRFPDGLKKITDRIIERGMIPGLWLEPEVVGVRSPIAHHLPAEAFFQRDGVRLVEHGRHHLDLRHPAARRHLDDVVDRLVNEFGVGYFKLDYNINPGPGTDVDVRDAGHGLLLHNRAHLDWIDGVLDRHPDLILENCSSGGLRCDYALLSRLQLQSTSDQQDPRRYPPIAAAANAAILPEQAASWCYPQPDYDDDLIVSTLACGLLGRLYLSGHLDTVSPDQLDLVRAAVAFQKATLPDIVAARPFWPLGMPEWVGGWIAHGLDSSGSTLLALWRRDASAPELTVSLPTARHRVAETFGAPGACRLADDGRSLAVRLNRPGQAVTIRLT